MKIAVVGAAGFVGKEVVQQLAARPDITQIRVNDRAPSQTNGPKIVEYIGDFASPALRDPLTEQVDAVIFLAAILGGAAEADYALARRVNLDHALDFAEHLRATAPRTRFVFASTIAAYAKPMPDPVSDDTPLGPSMVYGAQKLMMEVALSNFAQRNWLDAVSLRPSGVMARDGADAALKTAFMSRLFWCFKRGEDITLPVAPESRTWLTSVQTVAENFIHAALLKEIGPRRAFTLPALSISFGALVEALAQEFPQSPSKVRFAPDPEIVALFGSYPALETRTADALGFKRDADARALVRSALKEV